MRQLFGTDGIRGKAHEYPLDQATMYALGEALAHRLARAGQKPSVLLGMDTRESGPEIAQALAAGLKAGGGEATLIGVIPTPGVAYLCRTTDAAAGISISASHNPWDDNGVKIFGHDGMKLPDEMELEIEKELLALRDEAKKIPGGKLKDSPELVEKYEKFLLDAVKKDALAGAKVVLDTGHGAAYRIGPDVFRRAGAEVVVMNDRPDGKNINEGCGAVHPEKLAARVQKEKALFGVAFDGDADRAIFADDSATVRDGDEILYLWGKELEREGNLKGGAIVATVMSNFGFEKQLQADGIELLRASVGDKYVLEMMLGRGAVLGGEQSGHIIDLRVHTTGDGIHTALVVGELLAKAKTPLSKVRTFERMPQVLLNQKVKSKPPLESVEPYQQALSRAQKKLNGTGRILVRYSGTENLVRVMVEGEDQSLIQTIAEELRDSLKNAIGG